MDDQRRFDDIVRSERYFTATMLPAILFHDGFRGLSEFIKLVNSSAQTETDRFGKKGPLQPFPESIDANDVQIITEFHIARDLLFSNYLDANNSPSLFQMDDESPKRDAPDLVIVVKDRMIVCEGKFFGECLLEDLNRQLTSQRSQIKKLYKARTDLAPYIHVALLPPKPVAKFPRKDVDCDAVISWQEIKELSDRVLGKDHYVSQRFQKALSFYEETTRTGDPTVAYYNGIWNFKDTVDRCTMRGDSIQIGYEKGEAGLKDAPLETLERRNWKWRDPSFNKGIIDKKHWLSGNIFLEIVENKMR